MMIKIRSPPCSLSSCSPMLSSLQSSSSINLLFSTSRNFIPIKATMNDSPKTSSKLSTQSTQAGQFASSPAPPWMKILCLLYKNVVESDEARMGNNKPLKLDDIEGVDGAKATFTQFISIFQGYGTHKKVNAQLPKGVIIIGPQGTGKTLLAHATAREAGVSFFPVFAGDFLEVGQGAPSISDLFSKAKRNAPSIILIDGMEDIDGRHRDCDSRRVSIQLHKEMDMLHKDARVLVIAATNRPEILDPALIKSGRFSKKISIGKPDEDDRRKIFALYMKDHVIEKDKEIICNFVASNTLGLVGADLENIADEARRLAAGRGDKYATMDDVILAVDTQIKNADGDVGPTFSFASIG